MTKEKKMHTKLNKLQQQALLRIWQRNPDDQSYLALRRTVGQGYDCVMVPWCGMWLGIEADGHTHS